MPVVTINRGSYSRGKEVAEKLAAKLGYVCLSRDILLEASEEFNIPEIKLIRALHDPASVLERFRFGKERYISYLHSALLQHARQDHIVYHGLAGQYFLRCIPHVLKVRIIADMPDRVREEMRREGISAEKALQILQKDDEERRKWGLQVYGTDTWDSRLYDIVLRIGAVTVEDAVEILAELARKPNFQATAESRQLVEDLALAAKVKANLARVAPKVEVTAEGGRVCIRELDGASGGEAEAQVRSLALQTEGVSDVVLQADAPPEQRDHINPFHNIG
jgi:cytidylate kinase